MLYPRKILIFWVSVHPSVLTNVYVCVIFYLQFILMCLFLAHLSHRLTKWAYSIPMVVVHPSSAFLAHLSRRLTRWAYSIAMVRRCPSSSVVRCRRRPHFQTCISLKPAGQPRSNFMCSITGVGERLHKVLGQIRSKLWFPWQQKAPIDL